jgi:aryl-alcohol dehydrogenase-like predicted oxidoreductase
MQKRSLGQQGLITSALGLGIMGMHMAYGTASDDESIATIRRAHDLGVTHFDTAELYGMGTCANEVLLGKAVKEFRRSGVIATKFDSISRRSGTNVALDSCPRTSGGSSTTASQIANRLSGCPPSTPRRSGCTEDVAGTVKTLVDAGKVRYWLERGA